MIPLSHWNHRIVEFTDPDGSKYRAIHEVHYEGDKLLSFATTPAIAMWDASEGDESGKIYLQRMLKAFDKPVLTLEDFK